MSLGLLDFDKKINGRWYAKHVIPPDYAHWTTFDEVGEKVKEQLIDLCTEGRLAQLYQQALALYDSSSISPVVLTFHEQIQTIRDVPTYIRLSTEFYEMGIPTFFRLNLEPDAKNSKQGFPHLNQAGLGLPDKKYYHDENILAHYSDYLSVLSQAYGVKINAPPVMEFEKQLAVLFLDAAKSNDMEYTYNKVAVPAYIGLDLGHVIMDNVRFFEALPAIFERTALETLKDYIWIRVAESLGHYQSKSIRAMIFDFYGRRLMGKENPHDAKTYAIDIVKALVPTELEQAYVRACFSNETREACLTMVDQIVGTLTGAIQTADWMTETTKKASLTKLKRLKVRVGYPRDYLADIDLHLTGFRDLTEVSLFQTKAWYNQHIVRRFYQPVNPEIWSMAVYEVNASYHLNNNRMIIPAGILQKPFFGHRSPAKNLGGLGTLIGHELTHGFDNHGRKLNPEGNLMAWWTARDIQNYEQKIDPIRKYYSALSYTGIPVNGDLTLGENIADIGGVALAIRALKTMGAGDAELIKFFKTYAVVWRQLINKRAAKRALFTDPHALHKFRINVVLSCMPDFQRIYGGPSGAFSIWY